MVTSTARSPWRVSHRGWETALFWAVAAVIAGVFVFLSWQAWPLTMDDAYITLRQARNLARGDGFVYNIGGPRVESYTSHLLYLIQAACFALNLPALGTTKAVGVASGLAVLGAQAVLARDLTRWTLGEEGNRLSPLLWLLAPTVFCSSPILVFGAINGLETALFTALVTIGAWLFLRVLMGDGRRNTALAAGVVLGLGSWTRPEGLFWIVGCAAFAMALRWRQRDVLRRALLAAGVALAFAAALTLWRLAIFGVPFPNTYYIKMGSGDRWERLLHGVKYLGEWTRSDGGLGMLALAVVGLLAAPSGRRAPMVFVGAALLGELLVVALEGGDWMPHLRKVCTLLGVLGGMLGAAAAVLLWRVGGKRRRLWAASVPLAAGAAMALVLLGKPGRGIAYREAQTRAWGWADAHAPLGEWLNEWQQARVDQLTVAITDIGLVGDRAPEIRILDLAGLADPDLGANRRPGERDDPYPAERLLTEVRPEAIVLVSLRRPDASGAVEIPWRNERDIAEHPELPRRYQHVTTFTHKDFSHDGYYLHVFLRRDVVPQAPPANPPPARARDGA